MNQTCSSENFFVLCNETTDDLYRDISTSDDNDIGVVIVETKSASNVRMGRCFMFSWIT